MKIGLDDLEIMRKYRVQTRNYYVCSQWEEFTCGANVIKMDDRHRKPHQEFGISKKEMKVSIRNGVHGYLGVINGGS